MKKLSKEQSDWLIEKIDAQFLMDDQQAAFNDRIINIINQCTNKEFPAFEMQWHDADNFANELKLNFAENEDGANEIELKLNFDDAFPYFDYEQFKQFTNACNKICDWIEEQE